MPETHCKRPTVAPKRRSGGIRPAVWAMAALLLSTSALPVAEIRLAEEYRIKAALLHKLGRFVQWPETAFAGPDAPLKVCVLGDDPFGLALDILNGRKAGGRKLVVVRGLSAAKSAERCHILFIAGSERLRLNALLESLGQLPIFTVSDIDGFARRGGILQMYAAATRIRFVINRDSARRAGLRLAAPLLDLAEIVGRDD